jgi:S1-C subfamily serine protease
MKILLPGLLLLVLFAPLQAALPVAVNGQQLPSLAPMLERTTPAVVNIATRGKSRRRVELPLPRDPLFKHFFEVPSIIYSINKQLTRNFDEVFALVEMNGKGMIMNIQRGNRELYILLKW